MVVIDYILRVIVLGLSIVSLIALIMVHWNLFTYYDFCFSPTGFNSYLNALAQYKSLFTGTIATVTVYFGLLRLKALEAANNAKVKQDSFNDWLSILKLRFIEIEKSDPIMVKELNRIRKVLFSSLYELNFEIQNYEQLKNIFEEHISDLVNTFEILNNKHIGMGGVYVDSEYSYSYESFRFIFLGMIESFYSNIQDDLKHLYLQSMDSSRDIDQQKFRIATQNYQSN